MKQRAPSTTGFEHDRPYMKLDIWEPCEIEKKWGHDPATYPNQDLIQHYPTVQFGGVVECDPAAGSATQGELGNPVVTGVKYNVTEKGAEAASSTSAQAHGNTGINTVGTLAAKDTLVAENGTYPTPAELIDAGAAGTPNQTAGTAKPGVTDIQAPAKAGSAAHGQSGKTTGTVEDAIAANPEGYGSAKPTQPTQPSTPSTPAQPTEPTTSVETVEETANPAEPTKEVECPAGKTFNGTTCEADKIEEAAAGAVEALLAGAVDKTALASAEDLAKEAAALEEALAAAK